MVACGGACTMAVDPKMPSNRAARVLCAAACAGACSPEMAATSPLELPPVVWSGEHLDYAPEPGATPVCAGTLPYMDEYLELIAAKLGVDELGRYVYVDGDTSVCPLLGCYSDGVIYADFAPIEHEFVHAVRSEINAEGSLDFFEEGAAEMLGGDLDIHREHAEGDLREGFAAGRDRRFPNEWYTPAGIFAAYIYRYHGGSQATRALLERTTNGTSPDEAVALLEDLTAMTFDDLVVDFADDADECPAPTGPADYRYPVFPCDAPAALRQRCDGDSAVPIEVSLACDDPETIGPRDGELFTYVAIDIPVDGMYRFIADPRTAGLGTRVELKRCEPGCGTRAFTAVYGDSAPEPVGEIYLDLETFLRAGRYSLKLARHDELETPIALTIAGEDCQ